MAFFGVLIFIALVIGTIIWGVFVWAELAHGQKSVYTPTGFIVIGILCMLLGGEGFFLGFISLVIGIVWLIKFKSDEESGAHAIEREYERRQIEIERQQAFASQQKSEPWAIRYMTSSCPHCGHYKVRYAKWEDKRMSVAFWGLASDKIGRDYKCEHCGRMW